MKLTDFLQDVGRPVAYYPSMRKITGSTNATILLCQLIYWCGKQRDPNGWIYKSVDEVEEEIVSIRDLGLSLDRIVSWEVHPRVYLRQEFMEASVQGAPSKLERLRRDIAYTYGVKLDETPVEADAIDRGGRRGVDALVDVEGGGDRGVDALRVDVPDDRVLPLVDELVPDDGSDHG